MSFEIKNLPEVIKQAVQYGDLSPKEEVVKTPSKYKAYAFLGATNGQVFCVFAERRIAKDVKSILKAFDGAEGLEMVKEEMPDLIILDLKKLERYMDLIFVQL